MSALNSHPASPAAGRAEEPASAQALNRRGIVRFQGGDVPGALADFRQAALLEPNYAEPWNNSGLLRQTLGLPLQAVADFERALAIRPDYPEALANRGRARQALGDAAGARADFDRAVGLAANTPFAASALHNRGMLRQHHGDAAGALADFDEALRIDPAHTATYLCRGDLRKATGDLDGALADFDRALELSPGAGRAAAYHGRGGVRALRNDFAGAIADYDRALGLAPDRFHLYLSRGNARYHKRDPRGLLDFHTAFRLDPDGAARALLRMLNADLRRDADAVLDNCTKHLRLNDRDVLASARRGLTLLLLGRTAEAAPDLARFAEAAPDMQVWLRQLVALAGESGGKFNPAERGTQRLGNVISRFAGQPDDMPGRTRPS
jgi:tetratricopeptide (TPR) repeat protein